MAPIFGRRVDDRELKDVFAVQEEIATAIVGALRVPLGLKAGHSLVASRTDDTESYQDYLRARALLRGRGVPEPGGPLSQAAELLERVVARDPKFAPAWAELAEVYFLLPNYNPAYASGAVRQFTPLAREFVAKSEAAARRAIQLDPDLADGYAALGTTQMGLGNMLLAEESVTKALALDPNNPDALYRYSGLLSVLGQLQASLKMKQRLYAQEQFVPVYNRNLAVVLWVSGQTEAAIRMYRDLPPGMQARDSDLAAAYAATGGYKEAADALHNVAAGRYLPGTVADAMRLLRTAPTKVDSAQRLPRLGNLSFVYMYVGAADRYLEYFDGNVDAKYIVPGSFAALWHPTYAALRKSEGFKTLVRRAGLVEYWRARGWPPFCHPTNGENFVCE